MPALISLVVALAATALSASAVPHHARGNDDCETHISSSAGDTCNSIGDRFGVSGGAIWGANQYLDCNNIWTGTWICIPPANQCKETYYSANGDSCTSIDKKYNLVEGTIKKANNFLDCDNVWGGTPICVPDGPYKTPSESQCKQTYTSVKDDTCQSLDDKFNLVSGTIKQYNDFLTCDDIWEWTPICVPDGPYKQPSQCAETYTSVADDTCDSLDTKFNLVSGTIKQYNDFLTCDDIWAWTPICVPDGPHKPDEPEEPEQCTTFVIAKSGDTCATISTATGVAASIITELNPTVDCSAIETGFQVCLPTGTTIPTEPEEPEQPEECITFITAVPGDTCDSIAITNGIAPNVIVELNPTLMCEDIAAGTHVCTPTPQPPVGVTRNRVRIQKTSDSSLVGYLSKTLGSLGLPYYTTDPTNAMRVELQAPSTAVGPRDITLLDSPNAAYQYFGAYYSGNSFASVISYNKQSPAGSVAQPGGNTRNPGVSAESAIWFLDSSSNILTNQWVTNDGIARPCLNYMGPDGQYFQTAYNDASFRAQWPAWYRVDFVLESYQEVTVSAPL